MSYIFFPESFTRYTQILFVFLILFFFLFKKTIKTTINNISIKYVDNR